MVVLVDHVVVLHRRIVHELLDRLHGRGRDVVGGQDLQPLRARLLAEALLDDRQQGLVVLRGAAARRRSAGRRRSPACRAPCRASPRTTGCRRPRRTTRRRCPGRAGTWGSRASASACPDSRSRCPTAAPARRAAARSRCAGPGRCARARTARPAPPARRAPPCSSRSARSADTAAAPPKPCSVISPPMACRSGIEARAIDVGTGGAEGGDRAVDQPRIERQQVRVARRRVGRRRPVASSP